MPSRAPNILAIQADQMTARALSLYGHALVRTPHIERLAEHGTVFENAYCNFPLCVPSR
ncbi:MAG: sulfatase-like hydrolase/transferase, partial [Gammaproteobacteria bacterium]|nr:sulfatase-like hydrolase/transferase [Gammaproteobacteria bacterium]